MVRSWPWFVLLAFLALPAHGAEELSIEEAGARLKAQLAGQHRVDVEDVEIVEAEKRTWPDASLGCPGRRRLLGPSPVPGFRFVAVVGERRYTYHADTRGRFLRCDGRKKPFGPIS